ncbi:alpha and gamma adaptin binding protein p34 [Ophiocordyceps camponoti-floridani]|uniref:Alpha and gamma adaptin binding protein p34 n=1 Tax=Ophiocordyceps camponoti-floridani TaxID=2030778 RepID=A0A8H4Q8C8_9HYPO|nr:alpha and gamma adaptin binding protein p34 [Ophiocordyceps camponoti-floridani]
MEVTNPKRLLAVSLEGQEDLLSRVLRDLTGESPPSTNLAGTTHPLRLSTRYYTATIPTWLDVMASPTEWADSFLSDEAAEVLHVLGGLLVVFNADAAGGEVGREWDEVCAEAAFEFVSLDGGGLDGFGEKTGIARVKEALEANDWSLPSVPSTPPSPSLDLDDNLGLERADLEALTQALCSSGSAADDAGRGEGEGDVVADIEAMMCKLRAVREAGADLGEAQRRDLAAKAVAEVMRGL